MAVFGKLNSGWAPEVTLRSTLVGCPLYWKLNVNLSGKYKYYNMVTIQATHRHTTEMNFMYEIVKLLRVGFLYEILVDFIVVNTCIWFMLVIIYTFQ